MYGGRERWELGGEKGRGEENMDKTGNILEQLHGEVPHQQCVAFTV